MVRREIPVTRTEVVCDVEMCQGEGRYVCEVCGRDVCYVHTRVLCQPYEYHDSSGSALPFLALGGPPYDLPSVAKTGYRVEHTFCVECAEKLTPQKKEEK